MFWLRNKKNIFKYALLSGGLISKLIMISSQSTGVISISMCIHYVKNSVDHDQFIQLASDKPADLDLQCFQKKALDFEKAMHIVDCIS